jgi:GNAT superfamily N-acetyltransferase
MVGSNGDGVVRSAGFLTAERERLEQEQLREGIPLDSSISNVETVGEDGLGLLIVDGKSFPAYQRLAHNLAMLAKRELGLAHPAWSRSESGGSSQPHAFVLTKDNRAVGLFVARLRRRWEETQWDYERHALVPRQMETPRWSAEIIWVAQRYRGMGYGRLLINLGLFHLETKAQEMAWTAPVTREGERLVRSFTGERYYAS